MPNLSVGGVCCAAFWGARFRKWTRRRDGARVERSELWDAVFALMKSTFWQCQSLLGEGTSIRAAFPKRTRDGILLGAAGTHEKTISSRNLWPFLGDIGVP